MAVTVGFEPLPELVTSPGAGPSALGAPTLGQQLVDEVEQALESAPWPPAG